MNEIFDSPWNGTAKIVTNLVFIIGFGLAIVNPLVGGPLMLVLLVFGLLLWIRGIHVGDGRLRISTPLWKKSYDLKRLTRIAAIPYGTYGSFRLIASGGFFGYFGLFRSASLGNFSSFITDPENAVMLDFLDVRIVVSPRDPIKFVTTVENEYSRIQHVKR